jgi:hypothetical protein
VARTKVDFLKSLPITNAGLRGKAPPRLGFEASISDLTH